MLALGTGYAWFSGKVAAGELLTARRLDNLERFLTHDVVPYPLRADAPDTETLGAWFRDVLLERGASPALTTVAISAVAILLAAALAWVLVPLAASNLATARPFEGGEPGDARAGRTLWRLLRLLARTVLVLLRAVPEYLLAFLLLSILGPATAWPAVLALALHNAGILGRLGAETVENLEPAAVRSQRAIGGRRRALLVTAILPQAVGRFLLFFFYRFETCVREATVLGMLGVVSLGYWIQDARAKQYYDEMLALVGVGVGIVLVADLCSYLARRTLREAGGSARDERKAAA